ncbi:hypothetical protein BGZ92_004714 [Podila epicladia]|nr:hypothetical protein BGZ92_004714 [Podila epicladia]
MRVSIITIILTAAAFVHAAPTLIRRSEAAAAGVAENSPGWGSGNVVNVPIVAPVNACGNSVTVWGLLNPTKDNTCANA